MIRKIITDLYGCITAAAAVAGTAPAEVTPSGKNLDQLILCDIGNTENISGLYDTTVTSPAAVTDENKPGQSIYAALLNQ